MSIVAKSGGTFELAPAGTHSAVCVDVVDLGVLSVTYSGKTREQHKVKIVWQIEELKRDQKRFNVSKRYTLSLHEKAALRKDLESWRGRAFTEEECQGFDLETLIGAPCMLNIVHNPKGTDTYANVSAIMKLPRGIAALIQHDYVRFVDRTPAEQQSAAQPFGELTDEDVPF